MEYSFENHRSPGFKVGSVNSVCHFPHSSYTASEPLHPKPIVGFNWLGDVLGKFGLDRTK